MPTVKESFVLDWSWFHLRQRTVHTWVTWLPILHIPLWAHWECACVYVCVCRLRMGPFPWFHSSAIRMCLSEKEFGNVFLKQTREGREEKERENGSASSFWGGSGRSLLDVGWFFFLYTVDPEIPPVCVCVCITTNVNRWAFRRFRAVRGLLLSQ